MVLRIDSSTVHKVVCSQMGYKLDSLVQMGLQVRLEQSSDIAYTFFHTMSNQDGGKLNIRDPGY